MKLKEIKALVLDYDQPQEPRFDIISKYRGKYIGIQGDKGSGKTSLLVALTNIFFMLNRYEEFAKHKQNIWELRQKGFNNLKPLSHLIYGTDGKGNTIGKLGLGQIDYKAMRREWFKNFFRTRSKRNNEIIFVKGTEPAKEHYFDYKKVRMPNRTEPYIHFPRHSVLLSSETIDRLYNSKGESQNNIDIGHLDFVQKIRHKDITILDETQLLGRTQKWVRDTIDVLITVKRREDKFNKVTGQRMSSTWTVWLYEGRELVDAGFEGLTPLSKEEVEDNRLNKENFLRSKVEIAKIIFHGDIEKYYNSKSHEYEFDVDLEQYELENNTAIDFENYTKEQLNNHFNKRFNEEIEYEKKQKLEKIKQQADDSALKTYYTNEYKKSLVKPDTDNIESGSL